MVFFDKACCLAKLDTKLWENTQVSEDSGGPLKNRKTYQKIPKIVVKTTKNIKIFLTLDMSLFPFGTLEAIFGFITTCGSINFLGYLKISPY